MRLSRQVLVLFILIMALSIPTFVNAEIFLAQPDEVYNLDDLLPISLSVKEAVDTSGFLEISLVCPSDTLLLHREYLSIESGKEYSLYINWPVSITGVCYINAEFDGESAKSKEFVATDRIDIAVNIEKEHLLPGEKLVFFGNATKANSNAVEGFAEISVPGMVEKQYANVNSGKWEAEIMMPSDAEGKEYKLHVYIFEKSNKDEITNNGFADTRLFVSSVPSVLGISLNDEEFLPGEEIVVKPSLYDQAHHLIKEDVSFKLKDSRGEVVLDNVIKSEEESSYLLPTNAVPGDWQIELSVFGLIAKRFVYVMEHAAINVEMKENIIKIRNSGNVHYKKPFGIKFISGESEKTEVKNLDLGVGEVIEFELSAPEGVYDIEAGDKTFYKVPLTGLATAAIDLKGRKPGFFMQYPLPSFFIFVLLLLVIVLFSYKVKQNPSRMTGTIPKKAKGQEARASQAKKFSDYRTDALEPKSLLPVKKAQSSLVLHGTKQRVSVLFIRLKNLAELKLKLSKIAYTSLVSFAEKTITGEVEEQKGALHQISDSEFLAIFSPNLKQFRHEIAAIKAGISIEKSLNEHNSRLKDKADYGIGINSGELITNIQQVMLYTSVGKTISISKKIAEQASKEVLISKGVYLRVSPEIKAQKLQAIQFSGEEIELYKINQITVGREAYKSYVAGVLERMKKEEREKDGAKKARG